jgi:hypothetical protein
MTLPPPDHPYGYRISTLEKTFGPELYEKFCKWFVGQTGSVTEGGELLVYTHDVKQFLAGGGDLEFFDPVI